MTITWKGSPNKDGASHRTPITTIVIHWFGVGTLDSANSRFQNNTASNRASAHYGISDNTIYQWVKEEEVAWHAGVYAVNQRSIGIEHDATTTKNASEKTYQTSGQLVADICKRNNIPLNRTHIIGHNEVSATQCPGTLDIDKIISLAKGGNMTCEEELSEMRESRNKWKTQCSEEAKKHTQEMADKNEHIELMQKTMAEQNMQITSMNETMSDITLENKSLREASVASEATLVDMKASFEEEKAVLNSAISNLMEEGRKLAFEVSDLKEKCKKGLEKYSFWELLLALLGRR